MPTKSGRVDNRCLKHSAWQNQTCHLPAAVSTVTRQGSVEVAVISNAQKQHGPQVTSCKLIPLSSNQHGSRQQPRPRSDRLRNLAFRRRGSAAQSRLVLLASGRDLDPVHEL